MGIIRKQSIISTIYIYTGVLIGFVSTGILMPRFLTEAQNGIIKLLISYSILFAQLASLGFQTATVRFFPYFKDKTKGHQGFFILMMIVSAIGFSVFILTYYLIKEPIINFEASKGSSFANYFFLIIPITFFFLLFNQLDVYARVLFQSTIGTFLKELLQRFFILLAILAYIFDFIGFWQFIFIYVTALALPTIILFFYLLIQGEIYFRPDFSILKKDLLSQITSLSAYGLFIGFSQIAISQIDSILINFFKNPAMTGIYAITLYYGTLVIMPSRALFRIASSFIAEAFKVNDLKTIEDIQYKSCLNQLVLGAGIFTLLWLNIDNVFKILPAEYLAGKYVIFFIGLTNVIHMTAGLSSQIITNSKLYRFNGVFVIIYLTLNVVLNIVLIQLLGITGAALAAFLSALVFNTLKYIFIYRKFKIQPYDLNHLKILLISIVCYFIVFVFHYPENLIINIIIKSSFFGILFLMLNYFLKTSNELVQITDNIILWIRKW